MTTPSKLTADMLSDLEVPHEVKISPSGNRIVYSLRSLWNRPKGRWVASLWLAEVGKEISSRQITSGDSLDMSPQWSPDGKKIAYLSDGGREGVAAIWTLDVDSGEKPKPLTSTNFEQAVAKFAWSGNGKYIAYSSADEKTKEMKEKEERKEDAKVYGEYWEYGRLRVMEVANQFVTTVVSGDCHVYEFAWSPDSNNIAYVAQGLPEYEAYIESGSTVGTIGLDGRNASKIDIIPGYVEDLCWVQRPGDFHEYREDLWFRSKYDMKFNNSSKALYSIEMFADDKKTKRWHAYGKDDCATSWALPPGLVMASQDKLIVQVQSGLHDQLHAVYEGNKLFDELSEIRAWDAKVDRDDNLVIIVVQSTASTPNEVYSVVNDRKVCLSSHGANLASLNLATAQPFYAKARDGTDLDAILITPNSSSQTTKPYPTIVCPHGGPYNRCSINFDLPNFNWSPYLVSLGYAVLCPNYRGGSSHGEDFAASARSNAGGYVHSDTVDITKSAIAAGLVDSNRVAIAGWSYGGIISYLAVTRDSDFHFSAAMCGAGDTDWDSCIITTVGWRSAIQVAGRAPWTVDSITDTHNREASALWHMKDIKTPILILHGEDDLVVPISQARAFHYGCRYYGVECELVVYPREGHGIFPPLERAHFKDMLERMGRFFGRHLGMES